MVLKRQHYRIQVIINKILLNKLYYYNDILLRQLIQYLNGRGDSFCNKFFTMQI